MKTKKCKNQAEFGHHLEQRAWWKALMGSLAGARKRGGATAVLNGASMEHPEKGDLSQRV